MVKLVEKLCNKTDSIVKKLLWKVINNSDKKRLKNEEFSILCPNCIGGVLYSRLGKKFLTPTINMWMEDIDLIKFAADIDEYSNMKLEFTEAKNGYPIAKLGDITLHFNHYTTEKEAVYHWERRIKRINKENLFVIVSDRCGLKEENIKLLESIRCKGKIVFTSKKTNTKDYMLYLPYYRDCEKIGIYMLDRLKNKYGVAPFDGYFDYVTFFNTGKITEYGNIKAKMLRKLGRKVK